MNWRLIKEETELKEQIFIYRNTKYKLPNKQHIMLELYQGSLRGKRYIRFALHPFSINSPSSIYFSFDDLKYLFGKFQVKEKNHLNKCLLLADRLLEILHKSGKGEIK